MNIKNRTKSPHNQLTFPRGKPKHIKKIKNIAHGYRAKWIGEQAENYFENQCDIQKILWYKIYNPNYKTRKKGSQVCDYILLLDDGLPFFVDTKSKGQKPTMSKFFPPINPRINHKMTPTQKQTSKFLKMYKKGFKRSGFIFKKVEFNNDEMFFLSTTCIYQAQSNEDLVLQRVEKLGRLPNLIGQENVV